MNPNMVVAYELKGERVAVWKIEDSWIVTNTFTKKSLLCLSASQALDIFDYCLEAINGNRILN